MLSMILPGRCNEHQAAVKHDSSCSKIRNRAENDISSRTCHGPCMPASVLGWSWRHAPVLVHPSTAPGRHADALQGRHPGTWAPCGAPCATAACDFSRRYASCIIMILHARCKMLLCVPQETRQHADYTQGPATLSASLTS